MVEWIKEKYGKFGAEGQGLSALTSKYLSSVKDLQDHLAIIAEQVAYRKGQGKTIPVMVKVNLKQAIDSLEEQLNTIKELIGGV